MRKNSFSSTLVVGGIAVIAFFALAVRGGLTQFEKPRVLGISQFLADKGSDSGENKSSGGGDHGGGGSSGSSNTGSSGGGSPSVTVSNPPSVQQGKQEIKEVKAEKPEKVEQKIPEVKVEPIEQKKPKEKEQEIEQEDVDEINKEFEKEDVHVGTTSAGFTIKHNDVEAQTDFPLSVDTKTHELKVKTPEGTKTVSVLPDQAVQSVLSGNILDRIEGNVASGGGQKVELTQVDNQPVFVIKGLDDKRFLGFIPLAVAKTAFVSAQNGRVVRTDVDLLNKLLDALSF